MSAIVEITQPLCEIVEISATAGLLFDVTGPPLSTGTGALGYTHVQSVPATVWTMTHNLGYDPAGIVVIDGTGFYLDWFGVQYLMSNVSLRLSFDIAVSGTAYLS